VVDDSPSLRFMLRVFLQDAGLEVEEAGSGRQALERLARADGDRPDVVVVDQRMPDLSGIELARALLARGAPPRLVLFTSHLDPALEAEARRLDLTTVLKSDLAGLVAELRDEHPMAA
jgi:CheY-like chemotaxis protein